MNITQDPSPAQNATVHLYNIAFPTTSLGFRSDIITLNCLHVLVLLILLIVSHYIVLFIYSAIAASRPYDMLINHHHHHHHLLLLLLLLLQTLYLTPH